MDFELNCVCKGVTHIRDCMGVCMTLLEGDKAALLVDTGYGVEDVSAFVSTLTDRPLTVLLTHNHHDHALGSRWFDKTVMLPEDMGEWPRFTGIEKRRVVFSQVQGRGIRVIEDEFFAGECRLPYAIHGGEIDLGGMTAQIIPCPGHTPGSCVVYLPQARLLLTGDDWNPCTWLFFPEALGVMAYRENIHRLQAHDFTHVLCSHQPELFPRNRFDDFVNNLTDAVLDAAKPVTIGGYEHIDTRQADITDGQILVFDWNKYRKE